MVVYYDMDNDIPWVSNIIYWMIIRNYGTSTWTIQYIHHLSWFRIYHLHSISQLGKRSWNPKPHVSHVIPPHEFTGVPLYWRSLRRAPPHLTWDLQRMVSGITVQQYYQPISQAFYDCYDCYDLSPWRGLLLGFAYGWELFRVTSTTMKLIVQNNFRCGGLSSQIEIQINTMKYIKLK